MKNLPGFALLMGMLVLASVWSTLDAQQHQSADIFQARQMLIESFAGLDLIRIIEQNSEYFDKLGAGYDTDNRRFFIEQPVVGSQFRDTSLLILISYPRPDEAEVCLYAPENLSWQWARSRIRRTASCINAPLVFEPMQQPDDLVPYRLAVATTEFLVQQAR